MPQIKIERIVSFTSEDPGNQAVNILSSDTSKKWKTKTPGEKSASVVLQLDQPYVITSIDIGNENSAYIEVLVSHLTAPEDFKVLLVMSSFMSPLEARQSQNINKVRMFKKEDLSQPERNQKWDRVKIVCTQPFNRHVQYGLSFINLYTCDRKVEEKLKTQEKTSFLGFEVRPESPVEYPTGSLFARKKQEGPGEQTLKGAAAIRQATSLAHTGSPAPNLKIKHKLPATPLTQTIRPKLFVESSEVPVEAKIRNRNELLYSKDEEGKDERIDKIIEKRNREKADLINVGEKDVKPSKHTHKDNHSKRNDDTGDKRENQNFHNLKADKKKRKRDEIREHRRKIQKKGAARRRPFERLLEDVVLVISGIQNPDRASLRSMVISMGGKYKPDWDDACTHLICAFANTPKFNQVKGKGKIVTRKWLEDCYRERKKLPWRRYALDKSDKGPESEDEICEEEDGSSSFADDYEDSREQYSDTDDKIAAIRLREDKENSDKIFNSDTEDDETLNQKRHTQFELKRKLENFFEDQTFYVDESFDSEAQKRVKQYIVAYNGVLVENLEASIDIIITNEDNCKALKEIYPAAKCVSPDWVWECHNCQRLISMQDYIYD